MSSVQTICLSLAKKLASAVLFILFFTLSMLFQCAILFLPFSLISRYAGYDLGNTPASSITTTQKVRMARSIGYVCERATRNLPLKSKCLVQALLVKTVFSILRIPYVIYIGVRKPKETPREMLAHAWTTVGPYTVTGRIGRNKYTVLNTFCCTTLPQKNRRSNANI